MMKRLAALTILLACAAWPAGAEIVADIAGLVPRQAHSYAEVMAALQELHATERVRCWSLGTTHEGRTVAMAVVHDPEHDPRSLRKLLIIARQHGNEPAGSEAALALLRHFAAGEGQAERALLRRVALMIVPMANPDGASRSQRRNGAGVDLNRDWASLSQPETQAIEGAFLEWRPDVVIDLHELPAASSKSSYQENFVETIASCQALPAVLGASCGRTSAQISVWMKRYGIPLNCYYDTPGDDVRLCHRHFGLHHLVPSYLFESKTGRGRSLPERAAYHILGALVIANQLAYHHDEPLQPVQMAATPAPAAEPESAPAPEARLTTVMLGEPEPDAGREGRTLLWADVEGNDEFAYLTFELNGRVLVLSNREPYSYSLDPATCPEGPVEIAARAYDGSGRCIAGDRRTVTIVARSPSWRRARRWGSEGTEGGARAGAGENRGARPAAQLPQLPLLRPRRSGDLRPAVRRHAGRTRAARGAVPRPAAPGLAHAVRRSSAPNSGQERSTGYS